jgi:hypothetical protein
MMDAGGSREVWLMVTLCGSNKVSEELNLQDGSMKVIPFSLERLYV